MISLSLGDNFERIEKSQCYYEHEHNGKRCENMTTHGLVMPFDFPPMALCRVHAFDFRDWTIEDTLREMADILLDEQYLYEFLEEEENDNG